MGVYSDEAVLTMAALAAAEERPHAMPWLRGQSP
jgi:hypothetical protein